MTTFYAQQSARIVNGKLALVSNGGSVQPIGIRAVRDSIRQIEASTTPLADSTAARLVILKQAVALWEAQ